MKNPPGLPNLPLLQIAGHLAPETLGPIFFTIAAIARTAASSQSRSVMGAVRPSPKCRERVMRVRRVAVLKAPDPAGWLGAFGIPHVGPTKPLAHGLPNKRQLICTVHRVSGQTSAGHATNPEKRARTSSQRMYHGGVEAPFRSSVGRGFCWKRAIGTSA